MKPETLTLIDSAFRAQKSRILWLETPEGRVVVKGQRKPRDPVRYWLLSVIGKAVRSPLIKPVPVRGGLESQKTELARISALRAAGVSVPEVLHITDNYFVMKTIEGRPLDSMVSTAGPQAQAAFEQGLKAIAQVHTAGQYLSQGFARNMLVADQHLCFIDFEDDPLQVMTLEQAQARDYLLYLLSIVWLNRAMFEQWQAAWRSCKHAMNPTVRELIESTVGGLLWMRHLPRSRKPLGRDILQAQALAEFTERSFRS